MEITTTDVTLRFLEPDEGKALHKINTNDYFTEGIYLGKEEFPDSFVEVNLSDVPQSELEATTA